MSRASHQIKGLSLDRLDSLAKVVRNGGIARAADGDTSKQSLFSRQISELEQAMGVALMDRSISPHKPTSAAMALVDSIEALFRQFELLRQGADKERSELVIGAGDRMIRSYLMPILANQPRDGVKTVMRNLKSSAIQAGLMNHSIHLGVLRKDRVPDGCQHYALPPIRIGLFAPSSMSVKNDKLTWEKVVTSPLVAMEGEGELWQHWQNQLQDLQLKLDAAIQCTTWSQVAECMKSAKLAGFLPVDVARLHGHEFIEFTIPSAVEYHDYYSVAWNSSMAKKKPALQQLIDVFTGKNSYPRG
jgi:DNA-binding transcriptional LysR family regulator